MAGNLIMTIGMALAQARDSGRAIDVLVQGNWMTGRVATLDSASLLLADGEERVVVSLPGITAVRYRETEALPAAEPEPIAAVSVPDQLQPSEPATVGAPASAADVPPAASVPSGGGKRARRD